ncbi:hypothetical protein CHRYSEO8AT_150035 [Chryseobacterium sp. 8AT]|nr:hypothetical protein CHRYSEO8AT_150035 [Chryseobacterium sp. 8AT]
MNLIIVFLQTYYSNKNDDTLYKKHGLQPLYYCDEELILFKTIP